MSFIDAPIDDTVQLDEMAAEADDDNFHNFPPAEDDVRIVGGNERCPSEEEHAEIERKKNVRNLERPRIAKKAILTIIVLTCINLLNYMDRFTVAGKPFGVSYHLLSRIIYTDSYL